MLRYDRDLTAPQAASYSNCEEMEVIGAILYMGADAGAKQMSALFGSSEAVRKLVVDNNVDVRRLLDNLTTALKYVTHSMTQACVLKRSRAIDLGQQGWKLPDLLVQAVDPLQQKRTESNRDYYRRMFGHMLKVQLRMSRFCVANCRILTLCYNRGI